MFRSATAARISSFLLLTGSAAAFVGHAACSSTVEDETVASANAISQSACAALGTSGSAILEQKELVITDPSVVDDPRANWSFKTLIKNMLPSAAPTDVELDAFVRAWLGNWLTNQTVNGFVVPARTAVAVSVIDAWPKIAGTTRLDLDKAPFRLLAIVNRMDLRGGTGPKEAGEGRFVFGLLDAQGQPATSTPSQWPTLRFVAILEYNLPVTTEVDAGTPHSVNWWAEQWHELGSMTMPSAAFNSKLAQITDSFAGRIAPSTKFPNGNALAQLRTNENALAKNWELREFALQAGANGTRQLGEVTAKQTPDLTFNDVPAKRAQLVTWLTANKAEVLAGSHTIPDTLAGNTPFLAGSAISPEPQFKWLVGESAPVGFSASEWETAKRSLGKNTCNGCHTGEQNDILTNGNTPFLHIAPRAVGTASATSTFIRVTDMPNRKLMHFRALGCGAAALQQANEASPSAPTRVH